MRRVGNSRKVHPTVSVLFMRALFLLLSTHHVTQVSLALCPNEDRLCAVTSDNQLFEVKIITQTIKDSDMKPVISLFHGPGLNAGGITGMDTCVRKPLVATCGMDRTIRVWNIVEQRLDLSKAFQEEPCSLAMHPSGLHLAVGFADKIRLLNLLMDDVRPCHEISIKQCREVKFSNGGSMFAAVNGNVVTIFDFNTYDKLADLRGHNSKVLVRLPEWHAMWFHGFRRLYCRLCTVSNVLDDLELHPFACIACVDRTTFLTDFDQSGSPSVLGRARSNISELRPGRSGLPVGCR